jgi:hypothetical protein
LIAWSAICSSWDFLVEVTDGTKLLNPAFYYSWAMHLPTCIIMVLMLRNNGELFSERFRVQIGFVLAGVIMMAMPVIAYNISDPTATFWVCFLNCAIFGLLNGL